MNKKELHKAIENIAANKGTKKQAHDYVNSLEKTDLDAIPVDAKVAAEELIDGIREKTEKAKGRESSKPKKTHVDKILSGKEQAPIINPEGKDIVVALPDTCKTPIRVRQKPGSKGSITVASNPTETHKLPSPPGFTDFYNHGPCSWSCIDKGI